MALHIKSDNPTKLLVEFNSRINQNDQKGKITTWERSMDGKFYTHKADNWSKKAWFKPVIKNDMLIFNIYAPQNQRLSTVTYGYYHGHLSETLLNHFDSAFEYALTTARPTAGDRIS